MPTDVRRSVVWYGVPEGEPRSLHIESASVNAPSPDEYQISYANGSLTLVYQRVAGGPVSSQYTLAIRGLLEWNDTSGDGILEDGSVVAYTPLGPSAFGHYPISHTETSTPAGVNVNSFEIPSNNGEITLSLTIADGFVALPSGQTLTPMEAKLTFVINHEMTSPATRLSLQVGLSTSQRVALNNRSWDDLNDFSSEDRAVNVTSPTGSPPSSAFFAWSNFATVNGVNGTVTPMGPTFNETTGDYNLYLSYPKALSSSLRVQIVHDPTMGIVSAAYDSIIHPAQGSPLQFGGDSVVYSASLAGIAAVVAGTALLVNRRRRKAP
ncbi:MAG TPA: hypothetical protein VEY12_10400 [Thermoplasmata archaeon]|nr:hypothetical protein [Thermoplasmata archaeon]